MEEPEEETRKEPGTWYKRFSLLNAFILVIFFLAIGFAAITTVGTKSSQTFSKIGPGNIKLPTGVSPPPSTSTE